jgi:hypothetical protein
VLAADRYIYFGKTRPDSAKIKSDRLPHFHGVWRYVAGRTLGVELYSNRANQSAVDSVAALAADRCVYFGKTRRFSAKIKSGRLPHFHIFYAPRPACVRAPRRRARARGPVLTKLQSAANRAVPHAAFCCLYYGQTRAVSTKIESGSLGLLLCFFAPGGDAGGARAGPHCARGAPMRHMFYQSIQ